MKYRINYLFEVIRKNEKQNLVYIAAVLDFIANLSLVNLDLTLIKPRSTVLNANKTELSFKFFSEQSLGFEIRIEER